MLSLPQIPEDSFDWSRWRLFSALDVFGTVCRTYNLLQAKATIRERAVGWCSGRDLRCRPKQDAVAVMFLVDDEFQWCHLRRDEFEAIFGGVGDE